MNIINDIKKLKCGKIEELVELKKLTTYKVGGRAKCIVYPENKILLLKLLKLLKQKNQEYKVIGNGSNLIFSDKYYDLVLISLKEFNKREINDTVVWVESGYSITKLALETARLGLVGLEFAAGIPGTVGGAIFMNAGAYNSDMGYVVSEVEVIDPNLNIKTLYNRDMKFKYRTSFIQQNQGYICLSIKIVLKKGNKNILKDLMEDRKKRRLISQPLEFPSAGSVFRNPENLYAGKLIEDLGLKGYSINGAEISQKHANFIINKGTARGEDIIELINVIKKSVKDAYDIDLKVEQEIVE